VCTVISFDVSNHYLCSPLSAVSSPSQWPILRSEYLALRAISTWSNNRTRATASILTNLSAVGELGRAWQSQPLIDYEASLSKHVTNANAGNLLGNYMFYANDYMVNIFQVYHSVCLTGIVVYQIHRGPNHVSALKMWSARTRDSECLNSQNVNDRRHTITDSTHP
jgi:hypothetical protein